MSARSFVRSARYRLHTLACDVRDRFGPQPPTPGFGVPERRVLFVCLGNICRSPLAAGIFRARLAEEGLYGRVVVDSAGTRVPYPGRPPDPRARDCARRHGTTIGDVRTSQFEQADYDLFDEIVVLDRQNLREVLAQARSDDDRARVSLLLADPEEDVIDPVLGGRADFERAFEQIARGVDLLLERTRPAPARSSARST
jgi:protein-tyrosine phosphatase